MKRSLLIFIILWNCVVSVYSFERETLSPCSLFSGQISADHLVNEHITAEKTQSVIMQFIGRAALALIPFAIIFYFMFNYIPQDNYLDQYIYHTDTDPDRYYKNNPQERRLREYKISPEDFIAAGQIRGSRKIDGLDAYLYLDDYTYNKMLTLLKVKDRLPEGFFDGLKGVADNNTLKVVDNTFKSTEFSKFTGLYIDPGVIFLKSTDLAKERKIINLLLHELWHLNINENDIDSLKQDIGSDGLRAMLRSMIFQDFFPYDDSEVFAEEILVRMHAGWIEDSRYLLKQISSQPKQIRDNFEYVLFKYIIPSYTNEQTVTFFNTAIGEYADIKYEIYPDSLEDLKEMAENLSFYSKAEENHLMIRDEEGKLIIQIIESKDGYYYGEYNEEFEDVFSVKTSFSRIDLRNTIDYKTGLPISIETEGYFYIEDSQVILILPNSDTNYLQNMKKPSTLIDSSN